MYRKIGVLSVFVIYALVLTTVQESSASSTKQKCFNMGKLTAAFHKLKERNADTVKALLLEQLIVPSKKQEVENAIDTCAKGADKDKINCVARELTPVCEDVKKLGTMMTGKRKAAEA